MEQADPAGHPRQIEAALAGTVLEGRRPTWIQTAVTGQSIFVVALDEKELRPGWEAARSCVDVLGRWPVVTGTDELDWLGRRVGERPSGFVPRAHEPAVPVMTMADVLDERRRYDERWADFMSERWPASVAWHVQATREKFGVEVETDALLARFPAPDELSLERHLLELEITDGRPRARSGAASASPQWWAFGPPQLAFMPFAVGDPIPNFIGWEGDKLGGDALSFALASWRDRFGAELVTAWSTVLQLEVKRPPVDLREAFALAAEHAAISPSTPHGSLRSYARELVGARLWDFHERP
jgi:hypothetical protein